MRWLTRTVLVTTILLLPMSPGHAEATSGKDLPCQQWHALLRKHDLPVPLFSRIMFRESRCEPKAIGWNYKRGKSHRDCKLSPASTYKKCKAISSYDSGLLQINSSWKSVTRDVCRTKYGDLTVLLNPDCNLAVASFLFHQPGGVSHWRATSGSE
jgi:hypothetical protein